MTTETLVTRVQVLGADELDRLNTIGLRLNATAEDMDKSLSEVNQSFEKIADKAERSTDGFDRLRGAVDATTDRLRIFGQRGRAIADAIDDNISDPAERAERAAAELRRELSRTPTTLDKLNSAFGRGQAKLDIFAARLGPVGLGLGAAGVAGALGVATAGTLALSAAMDVAITSSAQFISSNDALSSSASGLDDSFESLVLTLGAAITGGEDFKGVIDEVSKAVDSATSFIAKHSDEIGGFFRTVALDALTLAESATTGIQAVLMPVLGVIDIAKIGMSALVLDAARLTNELLDLVKPLNDAVGIVGGAEFSAARAAAGGLERAALTARNDAQANALSVQLIESGKDLKNTIRGFKQAILGIDGGTGVVAANGARSLGGQAAPGRIDGFIGVPDSLIEQERQRRNLAFIEDQGAFLRTEPGFLSQALEGGGILGRRGAGDGGDLDQFILDSEREIAAFQRGRRGAGSDGARIGGRLGKISAGAIEDLSVDVGQSLGRLAAGVGRLGDVSDAASGSVLSLGGSISGALASQGSEALLAGSGGAFGAFGAALGVSAITGLAAVLFEGGGRGVGRGSPLSRQNRNRGADLIQAINSLEQTIRARDEREQNISVQNLVVTGRTVSNLIVDTTADAVATIERNNLGGPLRIGG